MGYFDEKQAIFSPTLPPFRSAFNRAHDGINARLQNGKTPLIEAIEAGDADKVKHLIGAGADVNARSDAFIGKNLTPLMLGVMSHNKEIVHDLINAGADVNATGGRGGHVNALWIASARTATQGLDTDIVKDLIAHGADVNARGLSGTTALFIPAARGRSDVVEELTKNGIDVNAQDNSGRTALMSALMSHGVDDQSREKVVKDLVKAGADINLKDENGKSALDYADPKLKEVMTSVTANYESPKVSVLAAPKI
jgi:ankyrin repeat protein